MSSTDKKMLDREALKSVIHQWNANRLDLFALSEPDDNLLFHGVMRFYFQDAGQKIATKCIRVASDATVSDVIDTLIEKFRPDMRMLSVPNYALYEIHSNHEERKLNPDEKPLLVQLNWHIDDREGRFLLRNIDQKTTIIDTTDQSFKRKLSKREKKEQKKKVKLLKLAAEGGNEENHLAEKLYTELPETSFTRSISNPEAVMRRRRQQKLEKKLQQFRSRDGGPDTGGTLKIYGESLCRDVPYKTLLLSIRDCAQAVVREMLSKYGLDKAEPLHYCLVQVNSDGTEYILDDDECPLSILMNHPTSRGSIMFHVRRRPADSQPRRRKKKPLGVSTSANNLSSEREGPMLVEVTHSGEGGRRLRLNNDPVEVGSANTNTLQLFGPSIQPRHCLISFNEGICTVTPLHADALTFVNGHHIQQPTIVHNGSVVMFGRVASFRFVDSPSDGRYNLALSQSQLDSACLYESRTPTSPSWNEDQSVSALSILNQPISSQNMKNFDSFEQSTNKKNSKINYDKTLYGEQNDEKSRETDINFDPDGNMETETKSISSNKSNGSNQERTQKSNVNLDLQGQEPILPAVLEFPETHQDNFLRQVITDLDVNGPNFKLSPVYTLYLCARYRASTHYRPELQPTERAHKLTIFLHHVGNLIHNNVQEQYTDPRILAFWMANSSELLHFLKSDRHISAFSVQAQEVLAETVQTAFRNLVNCFRVELSQTLNQFLSENIDHDSAAGLVLTILGSAMALLRRCRVNAALTIQLFSQLFHYINVICFNTIVTNSHMCTAEWGKVMTERLQILENWAERQGLEVAADCHLAKINQCAQFLQAPKTNVEEIQQLACSCFRLNSLQMAALLQKEKIPRNLIDTAIRMAESVADELTRADGREIKLEESPELHLALLLSDDGFSCDVVRGIPPGLVDFLNPFQAAGMCRLAAQPSSVGLWTVYMHQFNMRSPSSMSNKPPQPEIQVIKLHKNANGMGLSIVAAKGAGQERLGIYIKSVVPGGAADVDGRLQAGDHLLRVDGQSLVGITQERAADYLVRTGPVVTLEVAKQGAIYHGLSTLLQQPSPVIQRGNRRMSERDLSRVGTESRAPQPLPPNLYLPNSKSVPALHHVGNTGIANNKSRSIHNLVNNNEQGFYQNLSVYRTHTSNQPLLNERQPIMQNTYHSNNSSSINHPPPSSRPASAYLVSNNLPNTQNISKGNFIKDMRNNQLTAPSMPNISTASGFNPNISASLSMQNVNAIGSNICNSGPGLQYSYDNNQNTGITMQGYEHSNSTRFANMLPSNQIRGHNKFVEIGDTINRRNPNSDNMHNNIDGQQLKTHPNVGIKTNTLKENTINYGSQQLSPNKILPPVNPKPLLTRTQDYLPITELSPPLPPTTTHPLFKENNVQGSGMNYIASTLDAPKVAYYPVSSGAISSNAQKNFIGNNPWEREEREKENEIRREHIRQWRDQQIESLSALNNRTQQQDELLKTLMLERDFERRVQEMEEHEDENEILYNKENVKEVIRLSNQLNPTTTTTTNQIKQNDLKLNTNKIMTTTENSIPAMADPQYTQGYTVQQSQIVSTTSGIQPKSILKHNRHDNLNPSLQLSPSKSLKSTKFADDHRLQNDHMLTHLSSEMRKIDLDSSIDKKQMESNMETERILLEQQEIYSQNTTNSAPPPPPERKSSYVVMSQQQQKYRPHNPVQNNNSSIGNNILLEPYNSGIFTSDTIKRSIQNNPSINNNIPSSNSNLNDLSFNNVSNNSGTNISTLGRDNKRVSFHDEDNNIIAPPDFIEGSSGLTVIQENAESFIEETTAALQSPTTPESENWNNTSQQTPGVIGAQEVYRDPRQRRLQEQQERQQQKTSDAVPEKLSFKEKMKMFALESGENQTPKDKLKISRAQRDIDAVH